LGGDKPRLAPRLIEAHAALEQRDRTANEPAAAHVRPRRIRNHRTPDVRVARELKRARCDADDGVLVAVEEDGATDDRPVAAELPLPEPVAQHRDLGLSDSLIAGDEPAAEHHADAE